MGIGTDGELDHWAAARLRRAKAAVTSIAESTRSIDDLTDEIVRRFDLTPITFDRERVTVDGTRPTGTLHQPQKTTTLTMPMAGDVKLLCLRARTFRDDLAHARVMADHVEVDVVGPSPTQQQLDSVTQSVMEHVEWVNVDLAEYRTTLRRSVTAAVDAARARTIDRDRVETESAPTTRPATDRSVAAAPAAATPPGRDGRGFGRLTATWRKLNLTNRIAVVGVAATILCGFAGTLSFVNDVFPFRSLWNEVFPGPPSGAVSPTSATTSRTDSPCGASPGDPVLQVYGTSTPATLVFEGDAFPANATVQVDIHETAEPSSSPIVIVGKARADGCGKFSVRWRIPGGTANRELVFAFATTTPSVSGNEACCTAVTQVDLSGPAISGTSPIRVVSVQPADGEPQGSPTITVALAGSRPPAATHVYWLCALRDGKFHPRQSVSAKEYSVPTSLGDQPATWQILVVDADSRGSAALQAALERDGFIEGLPSGAQVVSNQITYHVTR